MYNNFLQVTHDQMNMSNFKIKNRLSKNIFNRKNHKSAAKKVKRCSLISTQQIYAQFLKNHYGFPHSAKIFSKNFEPPKTQAI
ncbi:hypothetical protein Fjoh_4271 [Flavobacterium johnsoniae UW101]|uniref:Uncharacterized protein n=1 Tax=Flavobacterium johnsoniae (strain ATCC 17061 / DSM 2064 / JCM 8514 / BCRC 14874 / CCUG 350202 / NBRC 14942 / NCIMB 11054 / UW101) TaxID=376686 RepID=A5FBY6_FLAJ1|nr:hypothetical protein Fjoh_4271 [Flavobacterium johnsoniae UW101]